MSWQDEQFDRLFRLDPFVQKVQGMEFAKVLERKEADEQRADEIAALERGKEGD